MQVKQPVVYIMASGRNGTIYIGSTTDLVGRAWQHRNGVAQGFTRKHGCKLLVWYEQHDDLQSARQRELQMKKWKRQWKLSSIGAANPNWDDLFSTLFEGS